MDAEKPKEVTRPRVGGRLRRHGFSYFILAAIVVVIGITALGDRPWRWHLPGRADADIWVPAAVALGTLAAVWASLWNADESAHNAETALLIARETTDREELRRHEEIRAYLSIQAWWEDLATTEDLDGGSATINVVHEWGGPAMVLTVLIIPQQALPNVEHFTLIFGDTLRPATSERSPEPTTHIGEAKYQTGWAQFTIGSMWWLVIRSQDVYGWWWQQRSELVRFDRWMSRLDGSRVNVMPDKGIYKLPVRLGAPTRVYDAYPTADELRTLRGL